MKLSSLLRVHDLVGAGTEMWWRLTTPESQCAPDEPMPSLERLEGIRIEWPARYNWPAAAHWAVHALEGFRRYVPVTFADIPQPFDGIVVFEAVAPGRRIRVALDYWDYQDRIDPVCARESAVYLKMQYLKEGYGSDHIVPGLFVASKATIYSLIPPLRRARRTQARYDVYGRFGVRFAGDLRRRAVSLLQDAPGLRFGGGTTLVLWSRSLREAASSKLCLDLPGNGDFCFRLVDYLAIGGCVISLPHRTTLAPPLEDRRHLIYCKPDLSDLVELCTYYAQNEPARREIEANAAEYFDRHLHKDRLAAYYLSVILPALGR